MLSGETKPDVLRESFLPLISAAKSDLMKENIAKDKIQIETSLDIRYIGQSFELNIQMTPNFANDFHELHNSVYGYHDKDLRIEIVNIRLKATGKINKPELQKFEAHKEEPSQAFILKKKVTLAGGPQEIPFFRGEKLQHGNQFEGPAIIVRSDTTILIEHCDLVTVDAYKNLIISVAPHNVSSNEI